MTADRFEIDIVYANQAQATALQGLIQDEITILAARIKASNHFNKINIKHYHDEE